MTFSNPAGAAAAGATAYTRALLEVLGDRDPLQVLGGLLPWLIRRIAALDDTMLRRPEAPGKWSVIEVVQHLADSDLVFGYRLRMIVTEDHPVVPGYDQDAWARTFRYRDRATRHRARPAPRPARRQSWRAPRVGSCPAGTGGAPQRARARKRRFSAAADGGARPGTPAADRSHPRCLSFSCSVPKGLLGPACSPCRMDRWRPPLSCRWGLTQWCED